uniref:BRICHOS domain-containing protein n=1 Tax=Otolemur garnettii TaxID=30611 RepID=H0Y1M9_OTOGA
FPFQAVSSILVIFTLIVSLALMHVSDSYLLDGSVGTQSVHVNAFQGIVSIRDNNVLSEWDAILDYKNSLLAAKLFGKMACVLAKMDQAVFPSLDDIRKALDTPRIKHHTIAATNVITYFFVTGYKNNMAEDMCPLRGRDAFLIPELMEMKSKVKGTALAINPDYCSEVQLLSCIGLSICGEILGL